MQTFIPSATERWPMTTDVVDALQAHEDEEPEAISVHTLLFDPKEFVEKHIELKLVKWKRTEEQLRKFGE